LPQAGIKSKLSKDRAKRLSLSLVLHFAPDRKKTFFMLRRNFLRAQSENLERQNCVSILGKFFP
jgi:hypothetical protein